MHDASWRETQRLSRYVYGSNQIGVGILACRRPHTFWSTYTARETRTALTVDRMHMHMCANTYHSRVRVAPYHANDRAASGRES